MPVISESVHPRSLNFADQKKVVILRDTRKKGNKKLPWPDVAKEVKNIAGDKPSPSFVAKVLQGTDQTSVQYLSKCSELWAEGWKNGRGRGKESVLIDPLVLICLVYKEFNRQLGRRVYKYKNCGRSKWKVTKTIEKFLVTRLLQLRKDHVVTSTVLARECAKKKKVDLDDSTVRKVLKRNGYVWLLRNQKPKYSREQMIKRKAWADDVLKLSEAQLNAKLALAIDGVVLSRPPQDTTARLNYCRYGDKFCYRKKSEASLPELAGFDAYHKQVPLSRALPMWGGVSAKGFQAILWHKEKKIDEEDWVEAVEDGRVDGAIKKLGGVNKRGPWTVLCDGESFLHTKDSRKALKKVRVKLWQIPPKSPDLNPIEKFWAWVRKELRARDFVDLTAKRPVPGQMAYKRRVVNLLKSAKAQRQAAACAKGLRRVCAEVSRKRGAASRA